MKQKIRYAIVGLGHIAQVAVLPAFKHAKNSELVALISSDPEKLRKLSRLYDVEFTSGYTNFEICLKEAKVDAVYIALPNTLHYEFVMRSLKAGFNVICEKPFATTVEECIEMVETADESDRKLMVAYRLHFDPANLDTVTLVEKNKIGDVKIFNSVFSMQIKDRENIRLKDEMGGGPVYDLGIYCINAARYVMRAEPEEVSAYISQGNDSRFAEVEEGMTAIMRFPEERLATFTTSFGAANAGYFDVIGTKGSICLDPAFEYAEALKRYLTINDETTVKTFRKEDQFAPELMYFADCILNNKPVEPSGYEGFADVKIIHALFESARTGRSVKLSINPPLQRPTSEQKYRVPPVRKAQLVHARPAS